jgi:hypothetical protein
MENTAPYSQIEQYKIWRRIMSLCTTYTLYWEGMQCVCEKHDVHRFELQGKSVNMLFELESSL